VARCNSPLTESEQQFQFVNNWTKIRGNHQLKFGGDIRYAMNLRIPSDNNRTGEYNFVLKEPRTAGRADGPGNAVLLGQVTSFARYVNNPGIASANRQKSAKSVGSSTDKTPGVATPKLTIKLWLALGNLLPGNGQCQGKTAASPIFLILAGTGAIRVAVSVSKYGLLERQRRQILTQRLPRAWELHTN